MPLHGQRTVLLCLVVLAAGCGSTAGPAVTTAAPTPVPAAPVTAAPATTTAPVQELPWEDEYQTRLGAFYEDAGPANRTSMCTAADTMTDTELRAEYGSRSGGDNIFDRMMRDLCLTPTDADYARALDIAVATLRERCA